MEIEIMRGVKISQDEESVLDIGIEQDLLAFN